MKNYHHNSHDDEVHRSLNEWSERESGRQKKGHRKKNRRNGYQPFIFNPHLTVLFPCERNKLFIFTFWWVSSFLRLEELDNRGQSVDERQWKLRFFHIYVKSSILSFKRSFFIQSMNMTRKMTCEITHTESRTYNRCVDITTVRYLKIKPFWLWAT